MKKIVVAHVLAKLDRGGIEVLLKNLYYHRDQSKYEYVFLLTKKEEGAFDRELKERGACIHVVDLSKGIVHYSIHLFSAIKKLKIDIIHAHISTFSFLVLLVSTLAGVKKKIVHSHLDEQYLMDKASFGRKLYSYLSRLGINFLADIRLACSNKAGAYLFMNKPCEVIPNAVDFSKCQNTSFSESYTYRETLGLSPDNIVVGHVGTMQPVKNHSFLIDVAFEVLKKDHRYVFVLVGDGFLKQDIVDKIHALGIDAHFKLLGLRDDVLSLMGNVFDVFLFPSIIEGMPVALIEAQASGLPCVISDTIDQGSIIFKERVFNLSLSTPVSVWSEAVLTAANMGRLTIEELKKDEVNPFDIRHYAAVMENIYTK